MSWNVYLFNSLYFAVITVTVDILGLILSPIIDILWKDALTWIKLYQTIQAQEFVIAFEHVV